MLNRRLKACAEYIEGSGIVCDIGTDHAHLPIYLVKNGVCQSAYACDIATGPLESAKKSIDAAGLGGSIRIIRSDGLENVPNGGVSDIVIAGMGGELIAQILSRAQWIKRGVNLVLQPNTRETFLVKWLYGSGFCVKSKKTCIDGRFAYVIFKTVYTGETREISEFDCITGGLDPNDSAAKAYIKKQADKLFTAAKGIALSGEKGRGGKAGELTSLAQRLLDYIE